MTSATSEKAIRNARQQAKRDTETNKTIISTLMSTVQGRRWIWLELSFAQVFTASETLDPARLAYNEGRRNTGLRLLASVTQHAPAMYVRMTEENTKVNLTEDEETEQDESNV